jgi:hypothetical protein
MTDTKTKPDTAEERERLLSQYSGDDRDLIENVLKNCPLLTTAKAIDMLKYFGGL